jgi:hypothetical protein
MSVLDAFRLQGQVAIVTGVGAGCRDFGESRFQFTTHQCRESVGVYRRGSRGPGIARTQKQLL